MPHAASENPSFLSGVEALGNLMRISTGLAAPSDALQDIKHMAAALCLSRFCLAIRTQRSYLRSKSFWRSSAVSESYPLFLILSSIRSISC